MVAIIKIVNGKSEVAHFVSYGIIEDANERRTDGLHRGQEVMRGMEWALRVAGAEFLSTPYSTSIRLFDNNSHELVCEFKIAMQETLDSPWYPWKEGGNEWDYSSPIYRD